MAASGNVGEVFVDLSLRADKMEKGLKKAEKDTADSIDTIRKKWETMTGGGAAHSMGIYGFSSFGLRIVLGDIATLLRGAQAAAAVFSGDLKEADKALEQLGFGFGWAYTAARDFIKEITGKRWSDEFKGQADKVLGSLNEIGLAMSRSARRATEDIGGKPSTSTEILRAAEDDANKYKAIWETAYNELFAKRPTEPKFEALNAAAKSLYGGKTTFQRTFAEWSAAERAMLEEQATYTANLNITTDAKIAQAHTIEAEKRFNKEMADFEKLEENKWQAFKKGLDKHKEAIKEKEALEQRALTWRGGVSSFGPPLSVAPAISPPSRTRDPMMNADNYRQFFMLKDSLLQGAGMLLLGTKLTGG